MTYGPDQHPEVPASFLEGYLWDQLQDDDPHLAALVEDQNECIVIRGSVSDPPNLNYFRDVVGLIQWLFDSGSVALYDPQSFTWWSPEQWRERAFETDAGAPRQHVLILSSKSRCGDWLHTRGLRKYGRPDLSIHRVQPKHRDSVVNLLNRFIEFQAYGGIIKDGEEIRIAGLPSGMTCRHGGDFDDPDFNNLHVEIVWPD
ncbi:MAG: hypothetical protein AAF465_17310 [Pseudomonadota bacterium]